MARLRNVAILGWVIAAATSTSTAYLAYQVHDLGSEIEQHEAKHIRSLRLFEGYAESRDRIEEYQKQGLID